MTIPEKIDKIFSMVSALTRDVAVITERDKNFEEWKNSQNGKIAAIEQVVESFKLEKAKLGIVGQISMLVVGFLGTVLGGILVIIITNYFIK